MSEQYESLRRSRCGCVHGEDGDCLMVCSTHTEAVEGRAGIRMRTASGELTFFPLARATPQPPPEESLCGEEEALAAGSFGDPASDTGPLPDQLHAWAQHVRGVGRSRQKAYAEALSLAQKQFAAWQEAFPVAFSAAATERGWAPLQGREEEVLGMFSAGFSAFLGETSRIAKEGGR
jgi:hypothetical protein